MNKQPSNSLSNFLAKGHPTSAAGELLSPKVILSIALPIWQMPMRHSAALKPNWSSSACLIMTERAATTSQNLPNASAGSFLSAAMDDPLLFLLCGRQKSYRMPNKSFDWAFGIRSSQKMFASGYLSLCGDSPAMAKLLSCRLKDSRCTQSRRVRPDPSYHGKGPPTRQTFFTKKKRKWW